MGQVKTRAGRQKKREFPGLGSGFFTRCTVLSIACCRIGRQGEIMEAPIPDRPRFSLRTTLLGITGFAILCWGCSEVRRWLITPRLSASQVESIVRESLPTGTTMKDVQAWLESRYRRPHSYQDGSGHTILECWIMNTGPPHALALVPDDIRMQFEFDDQDKLVHFTVASEPRF